MKNLIAGLSLLSMLLLLSCTKTIYTNDQVIDRYKTKKDVLNAFGMPTEKKISDTSERWLYRYDKNLAEHDYKQYHNTQTTTVNDFNRYNRYLIFSFDVMGNVIRADYTGVDLSVKKHNTGATIGLIAIGVALVALSTIAISQISFGGGVGGY